MKAVIPAGQIDYLFRKPPRSAMADDPTFGADTVTARSSAKPVIKNLGNKGRFTQFS